MYLLSSYLDAVHMRSQPTKTAALYWMKSDAQRFRLTDMVEKLNWLRKPTMYNCQKFIFQINPKMVHSKIYVNNIQAWNSPYL